LFPMRLHTQSLPFVVAAFLLPAACGSAGAKSSDAAKDSPKDSPDVIATVDGKPVRRAAFEEAVSKASFEVRQQYYDLQRQIVDQMILDSLTEKEAKSRGLTVEALRKAEIDDKIKPVTPEDIHTFYESKKSQMSGRTEDQMRPQLEGYLR